MSDGGGILTFTNLFPSSVMPTHGLFVRERMRRVAATTGLPWQVVAPVPLPPWPLRMGEYRRWSAVPEVETLDGVTIHHPRYRHLPRLSLRRQPERMAAAALPVIRQITAGRRWMIDAHYLYPDGVAAARVARELGLPYLLTARGTDVNVLAQDPWCAEAIAEAARNATACLAVSGELCRAFAAATGLPVERVQLARNGVDVERFRPGEASESRRTLRLPETARLLLGVGRLVAGKGFHLAAATLSKLEDDVELVLIGDGPERSRIESAAGGRRVHFLGAQPPATVAEAYRACDLLVLPSEREGWPNVVTEALASGLRVVATNVGGIPEILGDRPAPSLGALVPAGDVDALATAVREVLAVPADAGAVREFAMRYSWDQPVALLAAMCQKILDGKEVGAS